MVVVLVVIGMCLYYSYYFNRVLILNVLLCEFNLDILIILPMGRIIRAIIVYDKSGKLCKEYANAQGPGQAARPDRHPFYQKLGPMIIRFLEKANHENGFMYVTANINIVNTACKNIPV